MKAAGLPLFGAALALLAPVAYGNVICNTQQLAVSGAPKTKNVQSIQETAREPVEEFCLAFEARSGDEFIETRSRQLVLTITRTKNTQFSAESCQSHLNDIISRCIAENRLGGTIVTDGGFIYGIYADRKVITRTLSSSEDFNALEGRRALRARASQGSRARTGKPKTAKGTRPKSKKGKSTPKAKTPQTKSPRPQVPSVAEITKKLELPKDKIIFYSGPTPYHTQTDAWNLKHGNTYRALTYDLRIWKDPRYLPAMTGPGTPLSAAQERQFWENTSKAIARGASGVVHVMLPSDTSGTVWKKGSMWDRIEWPTLIKNRKVTKIIRINPDNDIQEVIRG